MQQIRSTDELAEVKTKFLKSFKAMYSLPARQSQRATDA